MTSSYIAHLEQTIRERDEKIIDLELIIENLKALKLPVKKKVATKANATRVAKKKDFMRKLKKTMDRRANLPILGMVRIKSLSTGVVEFTASDMEQSYQYTTENKRGFAGEVCVNPDDIDFDADQWLVNESEKKIAFGNTKVSYIPGAEFPSIEASGTERKELPIDIHTLQEGVAKTTYPITPKNFSPVLTGVNINQKNGQSGIDFMGTDSFRLAYYSIEGELGHDLDIIIPHPALEVLKDLETTIDAKISLSVNYEYKGTPQEKIYHAQMKIETPTETFYTLLIQGKTPDYKQKSIMPDYYNHIIDFSGICLKELAKNVKWSKGRNSYTEVRSIDGKLELLFKNSNEDTKTMECEHTGDTMPFFFGINTKYLLEVMKNSDATEMKVIDAERPLVMNSSDGTVHIIRPLVKG